MKGNTMSGILVLVRHGQSDWNLKNLFTGWRDPDLTPKGVEEAKAAGKAPIAINAVIVKFFDSMVHDSFEGFAAVGVTQTTCPTTFSFTGSSIRLNNIKTSSLILKLLFVGINKPPDLI